MTRKIWKTADVNRASMLAMRLSDSGLRAPRNQVQMLILHRGVARGNRFSILNRIMGLTILRSLIVLMCRLGRRIRLFLRGVVFYVSCCKFFCLFDKVHIGCFRSVVLISVLGFCGSGRFLFDLRHLVSLWRMIATVFLLWSKYSYFGAIVGHISIANSHLLFSYLVGKPRCFGTS